MTSLTPPLHRDCFNTLGIPVDNLSLDEAVERVLQMAMKNDGHARLVSTLNVDFLVNALGYAFRRPRHPELLEVLRESDMVTADGFPIVLLSKLLGQPLKQRVTGADIVPALAARAPASHLSLFLMGGNEGVAAHTATLLQARYPGLKIAGTAAPSICTQGPELLDWDSHDEALLEQINNSGADILLVGLGNPKQELWFNRNRAQLRVPVSIGVGGSFEFITGTVKRAPGWVQRCNLEWLYRITQDPKRLWRRYAKGLVKLALLVAPLLYYRVAELLRRPLRPRKQLSPTWQTLWSSRDQSMQVLKLPTHVSVSCLAAAIDELDRKDCDTVFRFIDFSQVKHVEMRAQGELFQLAQRTRERGSQVSLLGFPERLRRPLAAARLSDLLEGVNSNRLLLELPTLSPGDSDDELHCRSFVMGYSSLIFLSGQVDKRGLDRIGFAETVQAIATERNCVIDLRKVRVVETSALTELYRLYQSRPELARTLKLSGVTSSTRQMMKISGLRFPDCLINDTQLLALISDSASTGNNP